MKNLKNQLTNIFVITFLVTAGLLTLAFKSHSSETAKKLNFLKEEKANFITLWKEMHGYTMDIANAMPADGYSYTPGDVDSVRSFAQQMKHLAAINYGMNSIFLKDEAPVPPAPDFEETALSKPEIIGFLNASFEGVTQTLEAMDAKELLSDREMIFFPNKPKFTRMEYIDFMINHTTHHRAQALTYLRAKNITPPAYRYFVLD